YFLPGSIILLLGQRMTKGLPSKRTLAIFTFVGVLSLTFGLFLLITLLNTPAWVWSLTTFGDFLAAFSLFWLGCGLSQPGLPDDDLWQRAETNFGQQQG